MTIRFDGKVAIITGAGNGLGRTHALGLAARGAKLVINDLGGSRDGTGQSLSAAESVAKEIRDAGGEAIVSGANVTNPDEVQAMVGAALKQWGRIDILVNNAGILRDKTFQKMSLDEFRLVVDVHLMGAAICSKAVWNVMREQNYGRIVMTTSSSGLYGSFGQSNYAAAKMGVVGLMNTLHLEGVKYNIRVNSLAPTAFTRMTDDLGIPAAAAEQLTPEAVTTGLLFLVSEDAPTRTILCAGAGGYASTMIYETEGIYLSPAERSPENVAKYFDQITSSEGQKMFLQGGEQAAKFIRKAAPQQ
ncbi:MAG: SDR family NAD(P)-dependent oxidoreductase [Pseudomonadota bacterium]